VNEARKLLLLFVMRYHVVNVDGLFLSSINEMIFLLLACYFQVPVFSRARFRIVQIVVRLNWTHKFRDQHSEKYFFSVSGQGFYDFVLKVR